MNDELAATGRTTAWTSAKGGSGATTMSMIAASTAYHAGHDVLLVDLTGDMGVVIGDELERSPGIAELLRGRFRPTIADTYIIDDIAGMSYLPPGRGTLEGFTQKCWGALWEHVAGFGGHVVIDAGRAQHARAHLGRSGAARILVTRRCYQGYARTIDELSDHRVDGLVVVEDRSPQLDMLAASAMGLDRIPDAVIPHQDRIARWTDTGALLVEGHQAGGLLGDLLGVRTARTLAPAAVDDCDGIAVA